MISIYQSKIIGVLLFVASLLFLAPAIVSAQDSISLSVSPTLFDMTANPTQEWTSTVRVINANPVPLQVYTDVVNFAPDGEGGQGSLVPVLDDQADGSTLAEWITINQSEQLVPAEQTVPIEFSIDVPEDAPPGGHFAAILIGTRSFEGSGGAAQVETSQVVTALVFLRVAGDINESGQIRDFTTNRLISETPEMDFSIRFENTGNVHLQPQGTITITNMWGRERGVVPINQNSQFGNVLPDSTRKYTFSWTGDWSFADIGRYKAVATLAYGEQTRQFTDRTTVFWIIPWRVLLMVLLIVGGLGWVIVWGIKRYIRRMLQLAGVTPELQRDQGDRSGRGVSITAPIEEGILDLRAELQSGEGNLGRRVLSVMRAYRVFLLVILSLLVFVALISWYMVLALSDDHGYKVSYEQNGQTVSIPEQETSIAEQTPAPVVVSTLPEVAVVNRSGQPAIETEVARKLQEQGYEIIIRDGQRSVVEDQTVIVYDPSVTEQVDRLQALLTDALVSSYVVEDPNEPLVTIYLGTDLIN